MLERGEEREKNRETPDSSLDMYQQLGRNLKGFGLERAGQIDRAAELYEQNVKENFEGIYPYDKLAGIYRTKNLVDDEIRVLEKVVWILENIVFAEQEHRLAELERFKKRLAEARELKLRMNP